MSAHSNNPELGAIKSKLHELNQKVLSNPTKKLTSIQEFYASQPAADGDLADIALIIHSIASAGVESTMIPNQTTHLKAATPIFIAGMSIAAVLCLLMMAVGAYAIAKHQEGGLTEIHVWGASISTTNVGICVICVGFIGLVTVIRAAIKHAAFKHPPDNSPSQSAPPIELMAKTDESTHP